MINKGELYMGYENIDEVTRKEACEKVKQIVKAIKALRIKYYINFSRISEKDQQIYEKLERSLNKISAENDLDNLKEALMEEEINKYYGNENDEDIDKNNLNNGGKYSKQENILNRTYGAVDAEQEALRKGKLKSAKACKQMWKEYMAQLEEQTYKEMALNYKREKFQELVQLREDIEEKTKEFMKQAKESCSIAYVNERAEIRKAIDSKITEKQPNKQESTKEITI